MMQGQSYKNHGIVKLLENDLSKTTSQVIRKILQWVTNVQVFYWKITIKIMYVL